MTVSHARDPGRLASQLKIISVKLRDLHAALRSYPGPLPVLTPLGDIPAFLARPQTLLSSTDVSTLAQALTQLTADLGTASYAGQVLHGDAGADNLMAAGSRWVWHDFEDTCSGPAAWDLAASTATRRLDSSRVLATWRTPLSSPRHAARHLPAT